ncbi:hypothetical protein F5890DRAFT_1550892 [Lentinula detonsa]|uniref:Uncharacterized protein n=1 Tax=Lentinula detonsa TaxID=2804962 RepID=A0AA38UV28_9AGAR|nr:hypothetical protein F5890DRAFT_1550892 [Lentinula detonsa]
MFLSNSISYFLIGLVALAQAAAAPITQREVAAVPINVGVVFSLTQSTPVNVIHARFTGELGEDDHTTKPTVDPKIDHEVKELFIAYLYSIGMPTSFEIQYEDGSADHAATLSTHNFDFWGENVGDDCKEEQDLKNGKKGCIVGFQVMDGFKPMDTVDAGKEVATVTFDTKTLFTAHYDRQTQALTL